MTLRPTLVIALWCCTAHAGAAPTSHADALHARHSNTVLVRLAQLDQSASDADTTRYATQLAALAHDSELTALQREAALFAGTLRLATLPPNDTARKLLATLGARVVQIRVRRQDGHGDSTTPVYDVAAAAAYVERRWRIAGAAQVAALPLQDRVPLTTVTQKRQTDDVIAAGMALAVRKASLDALRAQRPVFLQALPHDPQLGPAALVTGVRLGDARLLTAVVRHADSASARDAIRVSHALAGRDTALSVLRAGLKREETASMSVFALATRYADSAPARELLMALLEDRRLGGSAAAALAKLDEPAIADRLADRLAREARPTVAARLALSLSLMRNDTAVRRLQNFVATPGRHADLRASLAQHTR